VPVYLGSQHKTAVKDITIDYSKRWQQVHLGAITAAYNSSPYFQFYFENIENIISKKNKFLLDLNLELLEAILQMLKLDVRIEYTTSFQSLEHAENDFRYKISPKMATKFSVREYLQVFNTGNGFVQGLSIIDLIFNNGPDAKKYL
jgi:hypothetical protein